ncbi:MULTISPECIES: ammonium transporter [unclassified Haladaptatus]|uniref:ammonium transporter n=1 Tax=unclassified Haladaptatus TaxID=2622732 RepID=UPI00209C18A2|nr:MULTISPECIES: ammonium transporter [unclassified Haladaptatus]MCO8245798.1 ammonium transporter [Haladaptatus sp. AB643]MCO8256145.1 ammonium transporter [Haladaptatus sp. AB618]
MVDIGTVADGVNNVWILTVSFLIFFMQPGFAMLEAGQVRAKNVANVLMKNLMDWSLGVLIYFLIGSGIAAIAATFLAPGGLSLAGAFSYVNSPDSWIGWLFGAVFAMTAATIVSGAVAERLQFKAYLFYSIALTAVIYPVIQGFAWSDAGLLTASGFLGQAVGSIYGIADGVGYMDFAGATVVHMLGGIAGLVGAYMVGPRRGRFDKEGNSVPIPGHSLTLVMLGTFILAFGWYGFNVGTQATVLDASSGTLTFTGAALGRVALNTTLGMGAGAVAAAIATTFLEGKPDPLFTANGLLAGLVAVTGAVPHVTWFGGIALGAIAGVQVPLVYRWVVDTLKVDDVCGVFCVHGSAGAIGTLLIPVFAVSGFSLAQFTMQTVGILTIAIWTLVTSYLVFKLAEVTVGLRVDEEDEHTGLDSSEHGIVAYPEFVESFDETGGGSPTGATDGHAIADGGEHK